LRRAVFPLVVVFMLAAIVAVALQLFRAQTDARDSAMQRFSERAQTSAALTDSVFTALGGLSGKELERRYGGAPSGISKQLAKEFSQAHVLYMAVLDADGKPLAAAGRPPKKLALGGPVRKGPALSTVVHQRGVPVIEYAIPFGPPAHPRTIVEGLPLKLMGGFLHQYLTRLRGVDGAGLAVVDRSGVTIDRQGRIGSRGAVSEDRVSTSAAVPNTPWTLRMEADRARVLDDVNQLTWLPWLLLASLALAALTGMGLYLRMLVTARRQRETNHALHDSRDQARNLVEALEEAVILYHADGHSELLNTSARELLDTGAATVNGLPPGWEALDDDGAPLPKEDGPVVKAMTTREPCTQVVGLKRPDGSRRWMTVRARPLVRPGSEHPYAVVASCADVTEQREMELHLLELAQRDPLTGLWNRRRFEEDLARQVARCRRYGETAALVVFDLDGFKQVNDTLGHLAGDEVLRTLADGLSQRLRAVDCAARMGGDEFAALLVNVDEDAAYAIARKVEERLTQFAEEHLGSHIKPSLSSGVALLDRHVQDVEQALEAADRAMYAYKRRADREDMALTGETARTARVIDSASSRTGRDAPLRALLTAVQARDSYTALHSRQVVTLARAVARRMGLDEAQVSEVESVALLHDLGKVAVPDAILLKSGPLSDVERALMQQHPGVGAQVVSSIPELEHLAPAIRAEHERWDGQGYPDGLAGEAIPRASRISFVCDAYDAMTSNRPYRSAFSRERAIDEIARQVGRQFCPDSAEALLDLLREEPVEQSAATI
jgi:diguanylate cyclase (GGDEF)-like protein/PAS domain S-box-containing protein